MRHARKLFGKIARIVAPQAFAALRAVPALEAEAARLSARVAELGEDLESMRRENDELHRASQRIAELTDLVVGELAARGTTPAGGDTR